MSITLGIDYGEKRIGLALSDPEGKLARRFLTLTNQGMDDAVSQIARLVDEENAEAIVVGLPVGFGGETGQTGAVRGFIERLQEGVDIPVDTLNEVFTSRMAEDNLRAAGVKDIKAVLDQEAARIILQDYIDHIPK